MNIFTRRITRTIGAPGSTAALPRVWPFRIRRLGSPSTVAPVEPTSLRRAIYARLGADEALAALIGDRISPAARHQGETLPALTFNVISNVRAKVLAGQSRRATARVQFNCMAGSPADAEDIAARVEDLFHAAKFVAADLKVRWSKHAGERDAYDPADAGDDSGYHRVVVDYLITYEARRAG